MTSLSGPLHGFAGTIGIAGCPDDVVTRSKPAKTNTSEISPVLGNVIDHAKLGQCRLRHQARGTSPLMMEVFISTTLAPQAKAEHHVKGGDGAPFQFRT